MQFGERGGGGGDDMKTGPKRLVTQAHYSCLLPDLYCFPTLTTKGWVGGQNFPSPPLTSNNA